MLEEEQNDKPTVLALREIADGHLDNPDFHKTESDLEKELAEELAKTESEIAYVSKGYITNQFQKTASAVVELFL